MNFLEAVKAMKEGKKVRRKINDMFFVIGFDGFGNLGIMDRKNTGFKEDYILTRRDIEATDWQIVSEETKTLSDKISEVDGTLHREDVKEAIKELCDVTNLPSDFRRVIFMKNVRELFGERLL